MAGKSPQPFLSVYAATKSAVIAYTQAMNKELNHEGVKSVAFCPGFVDTDMSDFIKESIRPEDMLRTSDIAEAVRFLLRLSPNCVIPEIVFQRPGEASERRRPAGEGGSSARGARGGERDALRRVGARP